MRMDMTNRVRKLKPTLLTTIKAIFFTTPTYCLPLP
jgi:hypothetical protein